jgi:catechol 2,3-dioxygenase-like lactoylglutathione lyase family enzyme
MAATSERHQKREMPVTRPAFKPKTASMVFYVSDIRRTEAFYNDTIGLSLERMEGAEPFWLQGKLAGGLELVYFEMPASAARARPSSSMSKRAASTTSSPNSRPRASPS